jgi:hypothetical protein
VTFTKVLTAYHNEFTPSISLLYASPFPGIVSIDLIYLFTYVCTEYLYHIHPPTAFSYILPPPISQ